MFKPDISFVHKYFMEEKQAGLIFLVIGSLALIVGIVCFFFLKSNPIFFRGVAIPLIAVGLIQGIVGYTVYSRSDKQRKDIAYSMGLEPVPFVKTNELPRMQKVMKSFTILMIVEIVLLVVGIGLFLYFNKASDKSFWKGLGLSLAIMALLSGVLDFLAEKRGKQYTSELTKMIP
jgi:uncharacterized membrane protein